MKKRKIAKAALAVLSMLTIGAAGASFAACGGDDDEHTHEYGSWTLITEPTLTAGGKAERYCKDNDGGKEVKDDVPALTDTNVWTENLTAKVDPTHTAAGSREFTSTDYGTVTVTLPADTDAHSYGDWKLTKDPTDTEVGIAERVCKKDGADHKEVKNDVPVLSDPVWKQDTEKGKNPTHIADGQMVFKSVYGEVTVTVPATAANHGWVEWTVVTGNVPTLEGGGKVQRVCTKDGADHKETEDVTALTDSESWTMDVKTPATHGTEGKADFTHKVYGVKITDVTLPKVEHTWGAWTIETEPTEETKGLATRVCSEIEGDCAEDETATETFDLPVLGDPFWTHTSTNKNYNSGTVDTYTNDEYKVKVVKVADDKLATPYDGEEYYCLEYYLNDDGALVASTRDNLYGGAILSLDKNTGTGTTHPVFGEVTINSVNPDVLTGEIEVIVKSSNGKVDTYPAYYDEETHVIVVVFSTTSIKVLTPFSDTKEFDKTIYEEDEDGEEIAVGTEKVNGTVAKKDAKASALAVGNDTVFAIDYSYAAGEHLTIFVNEGVVTFNVVFKNEHGVMEDVSDANETFGVFYVHDSEDNAIAHYGVKFVRYDEELKQPVFTWTVCDGLEGIYVVPDMDGDGNPECGFVNGAGMLMYGPDKDNFNGRALYDVISNTAERKTIGAILEMQFGPDDWAQVYYEFTLPATAGDPMIVEAPTVEITLNNNGVDVVDIPGIVWADGVYAEDVSKKVPLYLKDMPIIAKDETKIFMGWFLDAEGTTPVALDKDGYFTPVEDVTFYAKWSSKITLTISGAMDGDNAVYHVGAGTVLSDYLPEYVAGSTIDRAKGLKFTGWKMGDESVTEEAVLGENLTEVEITAQWEECLAYEGTYNGVYVYGAEGNHTLSVGVAKPVTIDGNGKVTAVENSIENKFVFMDEDNTFWIKAAEDSETGNIYGVYDVAGGIMAYASNTNSTVLHSGSRTYIMFVGKTQVTLKEACQFEGVKARLMTFVADDEEINVFMYNGAIYSDVMFDSMYGEVTAANAYESDQVFVYDKNHNVIANFIKDGDNGLVRTDGYEKHYEGEGGPVEVDGIGGIIFKGEKGTYKVVAENVLGVYVKVGEQNEYHEVTLNVEAGTYTSEKPEVTITFVDEHGNGDRMVENVNKNVVYTDFATPTHDNSMVYIFIGWCLDEDLEKPVPENWAPAGDVYLYAKYGKKYALTLHGSVYGDEGTVTYYYSDGSLYNEDGSTAEITITEPAGMAFMGWYSDEACTDGKEYDIATAELTEDTDIYAKWIDAPAYYREYTFRYDYATTSGTGYWRGSSSGKIVFGANGVSTSVKEYPFNSAADKPVTISGYSKESNEIVIDFYDNAYGNHKYSKAIIDQTTGIILFTYDFGSYADNPPLDLSKLFVLIPNDSAAIKGSLWNSGKTRAITVTIGGVDRNILIDNNVVYFGVTFKATPNAEDTVDAESCYSQETLYVYENSNLVYHAKKINGTLTGLDGREGDYAVTQVGDTALGFTALNLNGAGVVTIDSNVGSYVVDGDIIKLTFSDAYYEITAIDVDAKTCSVKKPMSTVKFNTEFGEASDVTVNTTMTVTLPVLDATATHDFGGWYLATDPDTIYTDSFVPTTDGEVVLTANWIEKAVVTFKYGKEDIDDVPYSGGHVGDAIGSENLAPAKYVDGQISVWFTKDGSEDGDWGEEVTGNTAITSTAMNIYAKWTDSDPYMITTTGDYPWIKSEDGVWTSTGKGINYLNDGPTRPTGSLNIQVFADAVFTLNCNEQGEANWDYLVIELNGEVISTKKSVSDQLVEYSVEIDAKADDVITLKFHKDSSGNKKGDCAQLTSVVCAVKEYKPVTLTYNYNGQGTPNHVENMTSYDRVETLQEVTFTNGEAVFRGWFTKNGSEGDWGEEFKAGTLILEDTVLYAKWEVLTYEVVTEGNYAWTENDGVWTSGNKGRSGTDSKMQISILKDTIISFHWDIAGYEDDYGDAWSNHLTITLKSDSTTTLVNKKMGTTNGDITSQVVKAGDIIEITYHRTSENYSGSYRDTAIISNIVVS